MVTALVQRLDLMNQRGFLADDWRRVKYAADDLRSIVNLTARHNVRTDNNRPFDFDFDFSDTNLRMSIDLQLNRRAERNAYREALFNYQQERRAMARRLNLASSFGALSQAFSNLAWSPNATDAAYFTSCRRL